MKKSTKFSDALHLLLHMSSTQEPATSEMLAQAARTNPVVVRRLMAGLRERGFVHSEKGHGGGWTLSCNPHIVTLYDVFEAIGSPTLFALGNRTESSECQVEKAVQDATNDAFHMAEDVLLESFQNTTLADVAALLERKSVQKA